MNLEQLNIANLPDGNFDFLAKCKYLQFISVTHLSNITRIDELSCLLELETQSLSTLPSWDSSGKKLSLIH